MESEESSTEYELLPATTRKPPAPLGRWTTILLAVVLGVGVHSSKESLGPAEPALENALGIGPVLYACLVIAPTALSLITPMLWGALWDRHASLVLLGAPLGELSGAAAIALGLHFLLKEHPVETLFEDEGERAGPPHAAIAS